MLCDNEFLLPAHIWVLFWQGVLAGATAMSLEFFLFGLISLVLLK